MVGLCAVGSHCGSGRLLRLALAAWFPATIGQQQVVDDSRDTVLDQRHVVSEEAQHAAPRNLRGSVVNAMTPAQPFWCPGMIRPGHYIICRHLRREHKRPPPESRQ